MPRGPAAPGARPVEACSHGPRRRRRTSSRACPRGPGRRRCTSSRACPRGPGQRRCSGTPPGSSAAEPGQDARAPAPESLVRAGQPEQGTDLCAKRDLSPLGAAVRDACGAMRPGGGRDSPLGRRVTSRACSAGQAGELAHGTATSSRGSGAAAESAVSRTGCRSGGALPSTRAANRSHPRAGITNHRGGRSRGRSDVPARRTRLGHRRQRSRRRLGRHARAARQPRTTVATPGCRSVTRTCSAAPPVVARPGSGPRPRPAAARTRCGSAGHERTGPEPACGTVRVGSATSAGARPCRPCWSAPSRRQVRRVQPPPAALQEHHSLTRRPS